MIDNRVHATKWFQRLWPLLLSWFVAGTLAGITITWVLMH